MSNVVQFRKPVSREQALNWLALNVPIFPYKIHGGVGPELFHGWRFVDASDGLVYFADCIHEGIDRQEWIKHQRAMKVGV